MAHKHKIPEVTAVTSNIQQALYEGGARRRGQPQPCPPANVQHLTFTNFTKTYDRRVKARTLAGASQGAHRLLEAVFPLERKTLFSLLPVWAL